MPEIIEKIKIQLHSELTGTGLMIAYGMFDTLQQATGKAYLEAQKYIDDQQAGKEENDEEYYITSLYFLEGGENMAFDLRKRRPDAKDETIFTFYFLEYIYEEDKSDA